MVHKERAEFVYKGLPEDYYELTELHVHVGSGVSPEIMWSLAHSQGIKTTGKDYWKFLETITVQPGKVKSLNDYLKLFDVTELIQSSPEGMEKSVYSMVGGAYRANLITRLEVRFNPMLRNRGGERDLDHIIFAAIRGMERATLEYPVKAGLILALDRRFPKETNSIIVDKAIQYRDRGVIGLDIAGPYKDGFRFEDYADLYEKARKHGLGLTAHSGETGAGGLREAIESLRLHRVGHGVQAAWNPELLGLLRDKGVTLEICPTSNLETTALKSKKELAFVLKRLLEEEVKFTINTDGPEMLNTSLRNERRFLLEEGMLDEEQLWWCEQWARQASFIK
jgi:adenosine deaminase